MDEQSQANVSLDDYSESRGSGIGGYSLYSHPNNSSSSTVHFPQPSTTSQVSSVGFNNLKKTNTNSQQSVSSSATSKQNPLVRLFKGQNTSTQQSDSYDSDYDSLSQGEQGGDSNKRISSSMFKLQKNKKGVKFTKNGHQKPELSIQTGSNLRAPKKIFSPGSGMESPDTPTFSRKNSFHNLFHRSRSFSQSSNNAISPKKVQDDSTPTKIGTGSTKAALSFSSNSSNSYVTDMNLAAIYNFNYPGSVSDDSETTAVEHSSLTEIRKKLMIPTDQFLQNKLHKGPGSVTGLGINRAGNGPDEKYLSRYLMDFGKENAKFYNDLLHLLKPLFTPKQQKKMANGIPHVFLGMTIEELSYFIKQYYVEGNKVQDTQSNLSQPQSQSPQAQVPSLLQSPQQNQTLLLRKSKSKQGSPSKIFNLDNDSSISIEETIDDELKLREISMDLLSFFSRCVLILSDDLKLHERKTASGPLSILTTIWVKLSECWEYFNRKVRFNLISLFHPLQSYLRKSSIEGGLDSGIEIENIILLAYRDIILIPAFLEREKIYDKEFKKGSRALINSGVETVKYLQEEEEAVMRSSDFRLRNNLISCCGAIFSHSTSDSGNSDGDQYIRDSVFYDTFTWLTSLQ